MKSAIQDLINRLNRPRHNYVPSTATFLELDLAKMKEELGLERTGRARGTENEPPHDIGRFDDVEQRIVTAIESEKKRSYQVYLDHFRTYGDRMRTLDIEGRVSQISIDAREAIADFRALVHNGRDELYQGRKGVVEAEQELDAFRREQGLRRRAFYPRSRIFHVAALAFLVLVESVINGGFLSRGHELGLLGGVLNALGIAVVNIFILGFFFGRLLIPNALHRHIFRKLVGATAFLGFFVVAGAFNLAVAHYRDALGSAVPEEAVHYVMPQLFADPLGIVEFNSWVLLWIGFGFAFSAVVDGFTIDDPYPGYGRVWRRRGETLDDYVDRKKDLMDELADRKDIAIEAFKQDRDDITKRRGEYYAIVDNRERMRKAFAAHLSYLERCANDLLTTYREANRRARRTSPPEHFSERWNLSRPDEPLIGEADPNREDVRSAVQIATSLLETNIREVFDKYENAIQQYQRIEQLTVQEFKDEAAKVA